MENKLKIPDDISLSNIPLDNLLDSAANGSISNNTDNSLQSRNDSSSCGDNQSAYQQNRSRHSGRRFRGAFAKLFGSKRRGTSMIDLSGKNESQDLAKNSHVGRKSLQMDSNKKSLQRGKRASKSMFNVNSSTPEHHAKDRKNPMVGGILQPEVISPIANTESVNDISRSQINQEPISTLITANHNLVTINVNLDTHAAIINEETSQDFMEAPVKPESKPFVSDMTAEISAQKPASQVPASAEQPSDTFGNQHSFDEHVSSSAFDTDWASFDNMSSLRDVPSDETSFKLDNDHVQSKSSPLWFDSTFVSQTTAELTHSFTQISSSTPVAMRNEQEKIELFKSEPLTISPQREVNNNSRNSRPNNEATLLNPNLNQENDFGNLIFSDTTLNDKGEVQSDGFGQEDLFSTFALTSEAREQSNIINDNNFIENISSDFFAFEQHGKKTENVYSVKSGKKSKSAFDLLLLDSYEQPNFDVFSDEINLDSDGGTSSPYDMRPSSALDREISMSAWNVNEDGVQVSLDASSSRGSRQQFFMRPTSLSGCQSVSNFSSAFTGSQNRLDKPAVKKMDILERPFEDDPFFSS